jgi:hypothetical protein
MILKDHNSLKRKDGWEEYESRSGKNDMIFLIKIIKNFYSIGMLLPRLASHKLVNYILYAGLGLALAKVYYN